MTAHALKLSLGWLFEISNILCLGWGNSRTHLLEKEKKNVDDQWFTEKEKENQEPKIVSSKKGEKKDK